MEERRMEPIEAVVFDLDGLMVNTEDVFHSACSGVLNSMGLELRTEVHQRMIGRRTREAFTILVDDLGHHNLDMHDPVTELIEKSHSAFEQRLQSDLRTMPGLDELLGWIRDHDLPRAVATSSSRLYLERILQRIELHEEFEITLTGDDVERAKPDPEIYLKAADALGIAPSRMLVFEDSEAGSIAAATAGARVVSIPHSHTRHHDFTRSVAVTDKLNCPGTRELFDLLVKPASERF